jgi:hypothetical protein
MSEAVSTTIFSLFIVGLCLLILTLYRLREKRALLVQQTQAEEAVALEKSKEERRDEKKECISNGLVIKEWMPDADPSVESTEGDQDTSPSGDAIDAPQSAPTSAPPINSSPASCAMGSDDCESLEADQDTPPSGDAVEAPQPPASQTNSSPAFCAMRSDDCESLSGEEERAGCAICLSHFEPQELVCESNNSSCQHVFHKDCMVDWLMKGHDTCPMCREVYLLNTV